MRTLPVTLSPVTLSPVRLEHPTGTPINIVIKGHSLLNFFSPRGFHTPVPGVNGVRDRGVPQGNVLPVRQVRVLKPAVVGPRLATGRQGVAVHHVGCLVHGAVHVGAGQHLVGVDVEGGQGVAGVIGRV